MCILSHRQCYPCPDVVFVTWQNWPHKGWITPVLCLMDWLWTWSCCTCPSGHPWMNFRCSEVGAWGRFSRGICDLWLCCSLSICSATIQTVFQEVILKVKGHERSHKLSPPETPLTVTGLAIIHSTGLSQETCRSSEKIHQSKIAVSYLFTVNDNATVKEKCK